jgi:hypothetical protein
VGNNVATNNKKGIYLSIIFKKRLQQGACNTCAQDWNLPAGRQVEPALKITSILLSFT